MKKAFNLACKKALFFLPSFLFLFCVASAAQNTKTVTGAVFDETGSPLPGVSIVIEGKTIGTTTNFDGDYVINAENSDTLIFSYLGYLTSKVLVENQFTINVTLKPNVQELNDVVVIGYGTQSRSLVSSSVSKVDIAEVKDNPSVNPIQALQGKVAGLSILPTSGQPGESATVFIRGGTQADSNSGDNSPLYIIDGVFRNGLDGLNAADIESIQVLKDAASTAIYGARAANGIILVTTKGGKRNTKGQFNINYKSGLSQQNNTYPFTSAADYIRVSRNAAARGINLENPGGRLSGTQFGYSTQNITRQGQYGFNRNTLTFLDDLITFEGQAYVSNLIDNQGFETIIDPVTGRDLIFKDNNYDDLIFVTAQMQDLNINANGGSENANYNVSMGYQDQEGTFLGTGFTRYTGLFNGNFDVTDRFTVNAGVNYSYEESDQVRNSNNSINRSSRLPHTFRLLNDDGTPALGESTGSPRNRLHELAYQDIERKRYLTTFNLGADWKVLKNISFRPSVSVFRDDFTFDGFEKASPEIPTRASSREERAFNQLLLNGIFNYKKSFGNHNLDMLWGVNYTKERRESIQGQGANAPTDIITTLNASATDQERVTS
jgi:TonB-linked SusC/RagA family outer membrane protein